MTEGLTSTTVHTVYSRYFRDDLLKENDFFILQNGQLSLDPLISCLFGQRVIVLWTSVSSLGGSFLLLNGFHCSSVRWVTSTILEGP